jgi:hypothetical protein
MVLVEGAIREMRTLLELADRKCPLPRLSPEIGGRHVVHCLLTERATN